MEVYDCMMENPKEKTKELGRWLEMRAKAIWENLVTNNLWQRMLKNTIATSLAITITIIPAVVRVYGKAAYLAPMVTVFGHPGRRFGMMAEALVLVVAGTLLGCGWALLGVYLSSLVYESNAPAAYTIKGVFLALALLLHGFLRSHTPRLFIFVLILVIVNVVAFLSPAIAVSSSLATQFLYPILSAVVLLLLVNTLVLPEFSSSFLGIRTIETLGETIGVLRDAGEYFVAISRKMETDDGSEKPEAPEKLLSKQKTTLAEKSHTDNTQSVRHCFLNLFHKPSDKNQSQNTAPKIVQLKSLTAAKAKLRAKLASCKAAQQECNFELAWAALPPRDLKHISVTNMTVLVANVVSLIGACESKYALMGDLNDKANCKKLEYPEEPITEASRSSPTDATSRPTSAASSDHRSDIGRPSKKKKPERRQKKNKQKIDFQEKTNMNDLDLVKPRKEIESADADLLRHLLNHIAKPMEDLQEVIDRSVDAVTSSLAYCYDVPKLPSGAKPPSGIELQEIDIRVDILNDALVLFDKDSAVALEKASAINHLENPDLDVMPRMETFLISSFLLNFRQAALHTLEMLKQSRVLVEKRLERHNRKRLYAPRIKWRKWLTSGGEEDMLALPESGRKDARTGAKDGDAPDDRSSSGRKVLLEHENPKPDSLSPSNNGHSEVTKQAQQLAESKHRGASESVTLRLRNFLADILEYMIGSEDLSYAIKLTVAVFLVSWPALLKDWNTWFSLQRGVWAALQLIFVIEVSIGTSVMTFIIRAAGTTIGCVWGYAAFEIAQGNRVGVVLILIIGIIPSAYVQLGSKYVKAGMVSIISMCVVALAITDQTLSGDPTTIFLRRLIAFLIGAISALVVELVLLPVKARDRLVESLAASIGQISEMEGCLAHGVESEVNVNVHSKVVSNRFARAKGKAGAALAAAETFLPFCTKEPRLKGSFKGLAPIYTEIIYVLYAIVDRMDNMVHLRYEYGSGVLEELNADVYPYRRNVAGAITLILFAVHEALTTKLPLPQFLPSARLAHLRMVNRVREVVLSKAPSDLERSSEHGRSELESMMVKRVLRQKFLSWNAASAGQIEVIEYLEELIDLVKLLVGANEFRSGMFTRPTYREYIGRIERGARYKTQAQQSDILDSEDESRDVIAEPDDKTPKTAGLHKRRTTLTRRTSEKLKKQNSWEEKQTEEDELPRSLQRVRTRRLEERNLRLEKSRSQENNGDKDR